MGGERAACLFYLCSALPETLMEASEGAVPNVSDLICFSPTPLDLLHLRLAAWCSRIWEWKSRQLFVGGGAEP